MKRRWQQQQRGSTLVTIFVDPHEKSQRKAQVLDSLFLIPPDVAFLESLQAPLQIKRRTVSRMVSKNDPDFGFVFFGCFSLKIEQKGVNPPCLALGIIKGQTATRPKSFYKRGRLHIEQTDKGLPGLEEEESVPATQIEETLLPPPEDGPYDADGAAPPSPSASPG